MLRQIALVALSAIVSTAALAQDVQAVEPSWRVISQNGVSLRCGPETVFYSVAEYNQGQLVQMDGTVGNQARVRYPDNLGALVPADEVRVINDQTIELSRASSLRAPSLLLGLSGSWKGLYESELPAGTRLTVRETLKNDRGQVVGYRVAAPRPPQAPGHPWAFVSMDALREATPAEVEAHLAAREARASGAQTRPSAEQPTEQPPQQPAQQPAERPAADRPGQNGESNDLVLDPASEPAEETPGEGAQPVRQPEPAQQPREIQASNLEVLEASFEAARRLPAAQLDEALEELLAEYSRTREASQDDERLAAQLDMRIEWLKLRISTREQRRAIEAALSSAGERSRDLERQVTEWRQGRAYGLVGRLVVSTVYNGERLPRMYRVQTTSPVDGAVRTLGYVTPNAEIESKLGRVVGVVGEPRFDPQLRLVIIRPDQIDVMPE